MGNTLLGGVLGDWDKSPEEVYSSKSNLGLTEDANNLARSFLGQNAGSLEEYANALKGQQPYLNTALSKWSNLADSIRNRPGNPMDSYRGIGDYWQKSLQNTFTSPLLGSLAKNQEFTDTLHGLSPESRNNTRYQQLLKAGLAQKTAAGILPYIINATGQDTSRLAGIQNYQDAFNLGLTPQEFALRNQYAAQNLLPMQARNQAINDALMQAYQSAIAHKANVYGYHQPTNFWDKMDTGVGNVLNTAERVAALYGQFSGMGGMGGGGKKPQAQASPFQYQGRGPTVANYSQAYERLYPQQSNPYANDYGYDMDYLNQMNDAYGAGGMSPPTSIYGGV